MTRSKIARCTKLLLPRKSHAPDTRHRLSRALRRLEVQENRKHAISTINAWCTTASTIQQLSMNPHPSLRLLLRGFDEPMPPLPALRGLALRLAAPPATLHEQRRPHVLPRALLRHCGPDLRLGFCQRPRLRVRQRVHPSRQPHRRLPLRRRSNQVRERVRTQGMMVGVATPVPIPEFIGPARCEASRDAAAAPAALPPIIELPP